MGICTGLGEDGQWLVSPQMAESHDKSKPISKVHCYTNGVAGTEYYRDAIESLVQPVDHVELVPDPNNKFDGSAVKVLAQGKHIGFLYANSAAMIQPFVSIMRNEGIRCFVPLTTPAPSDDSWVSNSELDALSFDDDCFETEHWLDDTEDESSTDSTERYLIGVMMLPTKLTTHWLCPIEELFANFDSIWDTLSDASKNEIKDHGWRFGESSWAEFREKGVKCCTYPFEINAVNDNDWLLRNYLVFFRRMIHNFQEERSRAARNLYILKQARSGKSSAQISQSVNLSKTYISSLIRSGKQGKEEEWRKKTKSIPASEELLKKKVLREFFNVTSSSISKRKAWIENQKKLDLQHSKKAALVPDRPALNVTSSSHDTFPDTHSIQKRNEGSERLNTSEDRAPFTHSRTAVDTKSSDHSKLEPSESGQNKTTNWRKRLGRFLGYY